MGILGVDDLSGDAPLMEAGLDSLSSVDFRNSVAKELPGVKLPSTLMFDHPTTKAIATFAAEQLADVAERVKKTKDGIVEIPLERWDVDAYYDEDAEAPGMMTVRHGGFIKDADRFDASFFGLSPAESKVMDPQQRLLLEVIYQSFHASGKLGHG
eukprot:Skav203427  [mRNA]  locus=scaffold1743:429376:432457:- [translate_table: standard]